MAEASIVFRNQDMSGSPEIYINTMAGAGALAAQYRNASHWVDVISPQDEVAHRWEKGNPDWENSDVLYFHRGHAPYDFVRDGDGFWSPENRAQELSEMLAFAFDVAVGNKKPCDEFCYINCVAGPDWTLQELVEEAADLRTSVPTNDAEAWGIAISDWMSDPERLFLQYHVEFVALVIRFGIDVHDSRVARLGVELAEIDANFQWKKAAGEH